MPKDEAAKQSDPLTPEQRGKRDQTATGNSDNFEEAVGSLSARVARLLAVPVNQVGIAGHQRVPHIGDIVHYRLDRGTNTGECRPAIIVRMWTPSGQATPYTPVDLQVFTDGSNDGLDLVAGVGVVWRGSVLPGDQPGQWYWPEYVPSQ